VLGDDLPDEFKIYSTWDAEGYPPNDDRTAGDPLPSRICGVYCFFLEWFELDDGCWHRDYLYIGRAIDCRQRFLAHLRRPNTSPFDSWLKEYLIKGYVQDEKLAFFAIAPCSGDERFNLEIDVIRQIRPRFNIVDAPKNRGNLRVDSDRDL
jgi:hypothetical protein